MSMQNNNKEMCGYVARSNEELTLLRFVCQEAEYRLANDFGINAGDQGFEELRDAAVAVMMDNSEEWINGPAIDDLLSDALDIQTVD